MGKDKAAQATKTPAPDTQAHQPQAPTGGSPTGGGGGGGGHKAATLQAPKGKGHAPLPDMCHSWGCKAKSTRFNFCEEHYDHFKFGLIKKTGEPVSDYEKKIEHYQAYVARQGSARKAA